MSQGMIVNAISVKPFDGYCGLVHKLINPENSQAIGLSCVLVEISPGQASRKHMHPKSEELYFVVSGSGLITIGSKSHLLSTGSVVYIPSGTSHKIENNDKLSLRLFVVNSPAYNVEDVIFAEIIDETLT